MNEMVKSQNIVAQIAYQDGQDASQYITFNHELNFVWNAGHELYSTWNSNVLSNDEALDLKCCTNLILEH